LLHQQTLIPYLHNLQVSQLIEKTGMAHLLLLKKQREIVMFKNYLKIALRNIRRKKVYSFINISGLAVGMAIFFLILIYIQYEFSYDRFHENANQIYRITTEWQVEGQSQIHESTAAPVAAALLNDFPEVINAVRLTRTGAIINHNGQSFIESRIYMVDPSFFDIFNFPLIRGNPKTALADSNSIVITEEMAEKYFGQKDPIGKTITFMNRYDFKITGISKNVPPNSNLNYNFLVRFDLINEFSNFNYLQSWAAWNFQTYILLQKDFLLSEFEKKSVEFIKKYRGKDSTNPQRLHLQPLTRINLETQNRIQYIYIFSAIAAVILLLACINFMNLSVAQFSTRAKEVGMRKVIGAQRHQLIKQFLGESIVISFLALPLALILAELLMPFFNSLLMTQLQSHYLQNLPFVMAIIGITFSVSIVSGSYPAFYQSALRPVQSIKGELKSGSKISLLRSFLIIFQFSVSIILIISTVVIYNQMHYIRGRDLGFNKEHIVNVPIYARELRQKIDYVKSELLSNPNISNVSVSTFSPGSYPNQSVDWEGRKEDEELMMPWYSVDYDFIKTFEIELIKGRDFSNAFPGDIRSAYILNECAEKTFGWENAVGKQFQVERADLTMGRVIGVMKDFHFASLHYPMQPLALVLAPDEGSHFSLKIASKNISATLEFIKNKFKEFAPGAPFEYKFLDDEVSEMYMAEERLGEIFNFLSVLAIFIACLGLLGLSFFAIARRTKEIGIRKVLGASVLDILTLLSKDFTKLVVIANVIAWPIAYYAVNKWLQNFAYRSSLSIWIFILAGAIALIIALITISFQSTKAAIANPADSLRYE
jgi:putative ABC transport system permease protein